jgi:osmotically-inducible protein OsmY
MLGRNQLSDKDLLKSVNQKLVRSGAGSQSRVAVTVQAGFVTLTGTLQYAIQRAPVVKAVASVAGVKRVLDQILMVERKPQ